MTTSQTSQDRSQTLTHLKTILASTADEMAAHLQADHGHNGDTPTSKPALARLHAEAHTAKPSTAPAALRQPAKATPAKAAAKPATPKPAAAKPAAAKPAAKAAPATPATPEEMAAEIERLRAELAAKPAKGTKAAAKDKPAPSAPKGPSAIDYQRSVQRALIEAAGEIVAKTVPAEHCATVAQAIANSMHHFATGRDEAGNRVWPGTLPKPARSDWR